MKETKEPFALEEIRKNRENLPEQGEKQNLEEHIEEEIELLLQLKQRGEFNLRPKSDRVFRNHYKNFQYDYEEDSYEPMYGYEEE